MIDLRELQRQAELNGMPVGQFEKQIIDISQSVEKQYHQLIRDMLALQSLIPLITSEIANKYFAAGYRAGRASVMEKTSMQNFIIPERKSLNESDEKKSISKIKTINESMSLDEMPDNITAKHIAGHLQITPRCAYDLMKLSKEAGGIPSFRIGKPIRSKKTDYIEWLNKQSPK